MKYVKPEIIQIDRATTTIKYFLPKLGIFFDGWGHLRYITVNAYCADE